MPDGAPPIDPDIVAARINALLRERRHGAVKPLLAALEKLAPDHRDLAPLRAAYCCRMQDSGQALQVLADAIACQPDNPALYLQRAEILFGRSDYAGATMNAADALLRAPGLNRAKSALGLALLGLQKFDMALPCLAESFAADPSGVDVALALAALAPENAIATLNRAIAASPQVAVLRNALGRRHLCAGDIGQASRSLGQARADGVSDAETYCLHAFALMQESHWEEAGRSAARAQSLQPGNPWAARLAAALGARCTGELNLPLEPQALPAEQALLAGGTILPGSFRALLLEARQSGPVLDLCCGSGLNAIAAHDLPLGPWTGIDRNPAMLALCAERGNYARLENCDPRDFLTQASRYPNILLNETLGHTASLPPLLEPLRACLAPGGVALAAIPVGIEGLTGHALFAHSTENIARQAADADLRVAFPRSGTLRHIEGIPLYGVIASFRAL